MGKWTAESTGMDVLRSIAADHLRDVDKKSRVWSEHLYSWGLFSHDANEFDEFLVWCSVAPGDRIQLQISEEKVIHTIVGIKKEMIDSSFFWSFKMITPLGQIMVMNISEHDMFKKAWNLIK